MNDVLVRLEINGLPATVEQLQHPAQVNYGHFTAMQVRRGGTRGLDLHLRRLDLATRELFGTGLDPDRIRAHIRHALVDLRDASVRVSVFWPESDGSASVMIAVRQPFELREHPQSLMPVSYLRPLPHIKHVGSFGQTYYGRLALSHGFNDALLIGPDGAISEGAVANIAFFDGTEVIWTDAPCLAGIAMQLLEPRLPGAGLPSRRVPVRLADLGSYTAAFVTNSTGVAPVGRIDDTTIPVDANLMRAIAEIWQAIPWDAI